jgi:hypothetical protein
MPVKNEALLPLFAEVKALLEPYARRLSVRRDDPGYYDLWSEREIEVDGRRRRETAFAGLVIQKSHVGFYFMPVYADRDLAAVFGPDLLATLNGKSCFRLKQLTPELREQITAALASGWRLYEERGWV